MGVLLLSSAHASVIGVSPSITNFPEMIKGGYAEKKVTVSTSIEEPVGASFNTVGEIADWIVIPDSEFEFSKASPYTFTLAIQPPEDAKAGNYSGILEITTQELGRVERGAGSSVIAQVGLLIYVEITGEEIVDCDAGALSVSSAEVGEPFIVRAVVENTGNVRLRPKVIVDVYDQYRTRVLQSNSFLGEQILPTRSGEVSKSIEQDLSVGQYFADVLVQECGVSRTMTFDVVEKGQIADSGSLIGIRTNDISYEKEPMLIMPVFRNSGMRKVTAQFKGEILDLEKDKVVQVLESDSLDVDPSQTMEFRLFYTPEQKGEYQISGRVVYNNKITFDEKSKVVKVVGTESGPNWLFLLIGYMVIGLLILILIGKIRKASN